MQGTGCEVFLELTSKEFRNENSSVFSELTSAIIHQVALEITPQNEEKAEGIALCS